MQRRHRNYISNADGYTKEDRVIKVNLDISDTLLNKMVEACEEVAPVERCKKPDLEKYITLIDKDAGFVESLNRAVLRAKTILRKNRRPLEINKTDNTEIGTKFSYSDLAC